MLQHLVPTLHLKHRQLILPCPVAQVIFLEKRVTELEKDTAANGEQHSRLKQENLQLVHR